MNIYLDSIGCRLNQSELETYARQFRATGHLLVSSPDQADLAVINTCTVTTAAAADSRQKIRQVNRAGCGNIVVTGCWATLESNTAANLPGVSQVIQNLEKDNLVPLVLQIPGELINLKATEREPIPGGRQRTRSFIKVQDGCNNHCSYCITCIARGPARSRVIQDILDDIQAALAGGAQEIILTGVHLGAWGADFSPPLSLRQLVGIILSDTDVPRLRLSSLEPWDLSPEFFSLWEDSRLCRHLHLPLQSGSADTLRRMRRKTTPEAYAQLIRTARAMIPHVAITTDIIVGFPGESIDEFQASMAFVKKMEFSGGHVFTYSERPGTLATRLPAQVPYIDRKIRNERMQKILAEAELSYRQGFLGQQLEVLWESAKVDVRHGWELSGLTDNYLRVHSLTGTHITNKITPVKLIELSRHGFIGQVIS